jgi:hypothetical protein
MKVLTRLDPIDESVPTLQRDKTGSPYFLSFKGRTIQVCFWPFMLEGCVCVVPYLPLHGHGRRVCGKSKGGQLRMCLDIVSEYLLPRSCPKSTPYKHCITHSGVHMQVL